MNTSLLQRLLSGVHHLCFGALHRHRLLYNACWEDPRLDRELFEIGPGSRVLVITSAGCNALDYLLDDPAEVVAVDLNPRQNALLELKLALIRRGDYADLQAVFGQGAHPDFGGLLAAVRDDLPAYARAYWEGKQAYFNGRLMRRSFYYHGTAGEVAWLVRSLLLGLNRRVRAWVHDLLEAGSLEDQAAMYGRIEPVLLGVLNRGILRHPLFLSMLGIHRSQLALIEREHAGGVPEYLVAKLRRVFTQTPMRENYFWRVYVRGSYTRECCPNYLKEENFAVLRERVHRVRVVTGSLTDFLRCDPGRFTHVTLLDHQDWLAGHDPLALDAEWRALLDRSAARARILLRSAGRVLDFLPAWLPDRLRFAPERTEPLHLLDRVGTYGSLHLAEVR